MYIEAVIVCVDYADFLAHTLPQNMQYIDRVVVVTSHGDSETRALCSKYSIECVTTDIMNSGGDKFNKAKAINLGLGHTRGEDWLLHLDADIVLPHNFKNALVNADLKPENLYGCDRVNVHSYEEWLEHGIQIPHRSDHYFVEPPNHYPLGARIIHKSLGYTPIGFFQLWHKSQGKKYPEVQGSGEHTDVLFAAQWAREHRVLLPDIFVYHLESEKSPMGVNWSGRKTKRFGHHNHKHHKPPYKP